MVFVNSKIQKYHSILDHVFPAHEHRFMLYHISSTFWVTVKFICIFSSSVRIRSPLAVLCAPMHSQPLLLHSSLDYEALSTPMKQFYSCSGCILNFLLQLLLPGLTVLVLLSLLICHLYCLCYNTT